MAAIRPRYSKDEFARRGDEIYERAIRPTLEAAVVPTHDDLLRSVRELLDE